MAQVHDLFLETAFDFASGTWSALDIDCEPSAFVFPRFNMSGKGSYFGSECVPMSALRTGVACPTSW